MAALCNMVCLAIHRNVMHRFRVQALKDPPLCNRTIWRTVWLCPGWSELSGTRSYFGQQDSGHPLIQHHSTIRPGCGYSMVRKCTKMYENYIIFLFFFTFFDVILCNFLRYVTFMFFNVYVLETLRLVTKNVWWCYMKCDVYVLKILRRVQYTLCATTFSNITSCDVNVRLRYVM